MKVDLSMKGVFRVCELGCESDWGGASVAGETAGFLDFWESNYGLGLLAFCCGGGEGVETGVDCAAEGGGY